MGLYNERLRPRRLQIGAFLRQNLWNSLRRGRLGIEKRQLEKAKTVAQRGCDVAKHEAERQALFGEAVADDAASRVEDMSIAPSNETEPRSEQASEERLEPLHERH